MSESYRPSEDPDIGGGDTGIVKTIGSTGEEVDELLCTRSDCLLNEPNFHFSKNGSGACMGGENPLLCKKKF